MNIEYRKATKNDNIEKIAELIYIVDPYIYPYWFSNIQNCKEELSKLILEDNFIFNINTTYIAINKDTEEILGVAQIASYKTNLDYDYSKLIMKNQKYKYTIENYIIPMINELKENKIMTVTNFSVNGSYRNKGIGTNLLDYALREETNNYKELHHIKFEVIAENYSALKVYNKLGFKQKGFMEEGFNGEGLPKPFVVIMVKDTSSGIRNVYLIEKDLVSFRRAGYKDNFTEIAQLLYQTDPYIYPYWFEEEQKCIDFLKEEMLKEGFIFNYNNLYIAFDHSINKVVGVICAIDKSVNLNYDYENLQMVNERYNIAIKNYIMPIVEEVKKLNENVIYIPNVCIDKNLRGKRIGSRLLGYFIAQMEKNGYEHFELDCLLHNIHAKNLYHGLGFKEMKLLKGFTGTEETVDVVNFLRKKGNYLPEEFGEF